MVRQSVEEIKKDYEDGLQSIHGYVQADLPPVETLPEPLQKFISSAEGMEPYEKMFATHRFLSDQMELTLDYELAEALEYFKYTPEQRWERQLHDFECGDCDDFTDSSLAILSYMGFDREDMASLLANFEYSGDVPTVEPGGGGHAVALVKLDGEVYMLDVNLAYPVKLEDALSGQSVLMNDVGLDDPSIATGRYLTIKIDPAMVIPMAGGPEDIEIYPDSIMFERAVAEELAAQEAQPVNAQPQAMPVVPMNGM